MQIHRAQWPSTSQPQGFRITYRFGTTNYCPGCSGTHWHVGRSSAQCAFCATAVPFAAGMPDARAA